MQKGKIRSLCKCYRSFNFIENSKYEGVKIVMLLKANYFTEQSANIPALQNIQNSLFIFHIVTHGFNGEKPLTKIENKLNQVGIY